VNRFVTAWDRTSATLQHIHSMFPNVLQKGKKGMFTGPQIQELLQSLKLKNKMSSTERNAWQAFVLVVYGFLGEKGDI